MWWKTLLIEITPYLKLYYNKYGFTRIIKFFQKFRKKKIWTRDKIETFEDGWYWYHSMMLSWCPCYFSRKLKGFRTWNDRGIVLFEDGKILYKIKGCPDLGCIEK